MLDALGRQADRKAAFGFLAIGQGKAKAAYSEIRVNGAPVNDPTGAQHARVYLKWRRYLRRLRVRWNRLGEALELPAIDDEGEALGRWSSEVHEKIVLQVRAAKDHLPDALREIAILFPFGLSAEGMHNDQEKSRRIREAVQLNVSRHRLESARIRLTEARERLSGSNAPIVKEMRVFLNDVVGSSTPTLQVAARWDELLTRLRDLRDLALEMETVMSLSNKIADGGAPGWAEVLRREIVTDHEDASIPSDWREAWIWAQEDGYLRIIDGRQRLVALSQQRLDASEELERVFREIVRARTFLALRRGMSDLVRTSLVMFATAIRQIGAGTGIKARRFRRDAREALDKCYSAVPCWIMPSWRVSESLPPVLGSFDLVIIDEASQSDMLALPAVLRGQKVLIVGDDKQVSPLAIGVEEKKIIQLRHSYLEGQPFAAMLLPGSSLYDLMGAVFPSQRIMLKEHFRCVEPIIRFSAREFYDNQIRPLRIPKASERLDPPLIDILVEGSVRNGKVNLAEAEVIVAEIEKIVADSALSGRSIGVVSLVGSQQAQKIQSMLLERIGEQLYVHHRIACGDSATFQGKERDIMFVSMVDTPNKRSTKTGLVYQQRFNVALSRARDRMYLVRSVDDAALKPDDLNARVIRHFRNPMEQAPIKTADAIHLCESGFEREVYTRLAERGWRVRPQVKAGDYRIDLVVEGMEDRRLAIELDGDSYHGVDRWVADYKRQVALERMGWRFWRCWASSWTLDSESCFGDLETVLRSMGITPIGRKDHPTRYTEHRTVGKVASSIAEAAAEEGVDYARQTSSAQPMPVESDASLALTEQRGPRLDEMIGISNNEDYAIKPGDQVVLVYHDEPGRHRTIRLTKNEAEDDPDMGVIFVGRPLAIALLGCEEEDVVEVTTGRGVRQATIMKVDRAVEA